MGKMSINPNPYSSVEQPGRQHVCSVVRISEALCRAYGWDSSPCLTCSVATHCRGLVQVSWVIVIAAG